MMRIKINLVYINPYLLSFYLLKDYLNKFTIPFYFVMLD